ncbi:DUF1553 domain-containing protein [Singulisphaera acidiphila]|uniref:Cytochrome c domain-containing protein n=1 Tax=Singulisphaera acidiphila (strain ATCC BAA-1392 / DSM 18658 / VKM B-2454 / MOB10) TaxID=886293 RepID=L0D6M3_SINAD|nr:DUF1553 domain-containing protein [Singulisphaera acidiphila]AGA24872.1 Protein of unknown function (DUF1553)/Protein of unknown function (DUF1549)/Planctomycete cytochrome C [Singulisphaera acidiphila DSM 18658]
MSSFPRLRPLVRGILVALGVIGGSGAGPAVPKQESPPEKGLHVVPSVENDRLPKDRVLVEICEEGVPPDDTWSPSALKAQEEYMADAFGFSRTPYKYIDTGIRADRANPFLLRAVAQVDLPAGQHRILLRGRGAARLLVDGTLLLKTPFPPPVTDGHSTIPDDSLNLAPDFRFAPPGNRESWTTFTSPGGTHLVILETIVGGRKGSARRPELGETVVAIAREGSDSFRLLAPHKVVPYNDAGWKDFAGEEGLAIGRMDAERRATALHEHAAEWDQRRERGRQWLSTTIDPIVPELAKDIPGFNAIDRFLGAKLTLAAGPTAATRTIDFPKQIRPILEAKCFSCHQGQKVRGQLRLDQSEGVTKGGASGEPAVVPGQPDESLLIDRVTSTDELEAMPPKGDRLSAQEVQLLRQWIEEGASWSPLHEQTITPLTDDLPFLRRVTLDTVGVIPTEAEALQFLADSGPDKRARVIDRLLADPRWADQWMGYWQDVLAENPNILNPTLNNSGPFRWWIYESLLDNKPVDLFVTELIRMRGSLSLGGPAGFAMASQNDVPMAEKAVIVSAAFLGVQTKCARCHDAPAHQSTQQDLFQLAALLGEKPIKLPKTSSVPLDKLHGQGRKSLIQVTLKPGTVVQPAWPFPEFAPANLLEADLPSDATPRDRLAALITGPGNERFAQVIANRAWKRLMGRGLVDPVDDWEKGSPSHPELLRHLGRELVRGEFDLKRLVRLILNSHAYQRGSDLALTETDPHFAARAQRRLSAEQIVDSLFQATGKPFETEEVNLDLDGRRAVANSINLGKPRRAWQLASTSNERDRPSLALPRVQAVVDVLEAFGWRPSRQDALTTRDSSPNLIQPAVLANGTMGVWLTRLSDDHGITQLALEDQPLERLVDRLFLRILTRQPLDDERKSIVAYLQDGYSDRRLEPPTPAAPKERRPPRYVSWSNHLTEEANRIKVEREAEARRGDPPTDRLDAAWRRRLEDVLWTMLNSPEFLFTP